MLDSVTGRRGYKKLIEGSATSFIKGVQVFAKVPSIKLRNWSFETSFLVVCKIHSNPQVHGTTALQFPPWWNKYEWKNSFFMGGRQLGRRQWNKLEVKGYVDTIPYSKKQLRRNTNEKSKSKLSLFEQIYVKTSLKVYSQNCSLWVGMY